MDDPILTEAPVQPETPAPPPQDNRMDRLEQAMAQLTDTVRDAANRLTQAPASPAPRTNEEFLNDLAASPQEVIRREAAFAARQVASEHLNPAVLQVLDNGNTTLMHEHEMRIDQEFGEGTYKEVFAPQLEKDISQLRQVNPRAIADRGTIDALVNRLYGGENFPMLVERRQRLEKTAGMRGLSHLIPGGGVPRLRVGNPAEETPPDVEGQLQNWEKTTGERIDRKHFAKLYHTGQDSGPGRHRTGLQDYLDVTGADKATKEKYGCS
jgi:hypothetical protein